MGPIGVVEHLAPFLPDHGLVEMEGVANQQSTGQSWGSCTAAPWGSPSILPISWMYCHLMGAQGLRMSSSIAILSANYLAARLSRDYKVLFTGRNGFCAHEFILDMRPFKRWVSEADVAKRLQDYAFHAPTMSWPVGGTIMVEPTESESKEELDRFVAAMRLIRQEIQNIQDGVWPVDNNPLRNAPHTQAVCMADEWDRPYSRQVAAYPMEGLRQDKMWPTVGRVDDAYGDRNLMCTCPSVEEAAA